MSSSKKPTLSVVSNSYDNSHELTEKGDPAVNGPYLDDLREAQEKLNREARTHKMRAEEQAKKDAAENERLEKDAAEAQRVADEFKEAKDKLEEDEAKAREEAKQAEAEQKKAEAEHKNLSKGAAVAKSDSKKNEKDK